MPPRPALGQVLPKLQELLPTFPNDLLVLNFGYCAVGRGSSWRSC